MALDLEIFEQFIRCCGTLNSEDIAELLHLLGMLQHEITSLELLKLPALNQQDMFSLPEQLKKQLPEDVTVSYLSLRRRFLNALHDLFLFVFRCDVDKVLTDAIEEHINAWVGSAFVKNLLELADKLPGYSASALLNQKFTECQVGLDQLKKLYEKNKEDENEFCVISCRLYEEREILLRILVLLLWNSVIPASQLSSMKLSELRYAISAQLEHQKQLTIDFDDDFLKLRLCLLKKKPVEAVLSKSLSLMFSDLNQLKATLEKNDYMLKIAEVQIETVLLEIISQTDLIRRMKLSDEDIPREKVLRERSKYMSKVHESKSVSTVSDTVEVNKDFSELLMLLSMCLTREGADVIVEKRFMRLWDDRLSPHSKYGLFLLMARLAKFNPNYVFDLLNNQQIAIGFRYFKDAFEYYKKVLVENVQKIDPQDLMLIDGILRIVEGLSEASQTSRVLLGEMFSFPLFSLLSERLPSSLKARVLRTLSKFQLENAHMILQQLRIDESILQESSDVLVGYLELMLCLNQVNVKIIEQILVKNASNYEVSKNCLSVLVKNRVFNLSFLPVLEKFLISKDEELIHLTLKLLSVGTSIPYSEYPQLFQNLFLLFISLSDTDVILELIGLLDVVTTDNLLAIVKPVYDRVQEGLVSLLTTNPADVRVKLLEFMKKHKRLSIDVSQVLFLLDHRSVEVRKCLLEYLYFNKSSELMRQVRYSGYLEKLLVPYDGKESTSLNEYYAYSLKLVTLELHLKKLYGSTQDLKADPTFLVHRARGICSTPIPTSIGVDAFLARTKYLKDLQVSDCKLVIDCVEVYDLNRIYNRIQDYLNRFSVSISLVQEELENLVELVEQKNNDNRLLKSRVLVLNSLFMLFHFCVVHSLPANEELMIELIRIVAESAYVDLCEYELSRFVFVFSKSTKIPLPQAVVDLIMSKNNVFLYMSLLCQVKVLNLEKQLSELIPRLLEEAQRNPVLFSVVAKLYQKYPERTFRAMKQGNLLRFLLPAYEEHKYQLFMALCMEKDHARYLIECGLVQQLNLEKEESWDIISLLSINCGLDASEAIRGQLDFNEQMFLMMFCDKKAPFNVARLLTGHQKLSEKSLRNLLALALRLRAKVEPKLLSEIAQNTKEGKYAAMINDICEVLQK